MGRKKERILELERLLDETIGERDAAKKSASILQANLDRATTSTEYEAAWETVRLEFGVKDKPIGPERAAFEVCSVVRQRETDAIDLRATVEVLQSDNATLRDLRDTLQDVTVAAKTALRRDFEVDGGTLLDVVAAACTAHRDALETLGHERNTTARLTEELAHARVQLEEPAPEGWSPFVGDRVAVGGWPRVYAGDHEGLGDLCYVAADLAEGTGRIVVQKAVLRPWTAGRARTAPASGQQHQDVPSIGAFDALGRENTRLRRKLERVFEALKDTPTEAP